MFSTLLKRYPSAAGFIAIIIWCFSALHGSLMKTLPIFEMLSIVFFISAFGIFAKLWFYQEWYKLKQPISMTIAGAAAIYGNDYFYFEAFKYAPASHVDLINYLWPILIIIFSGLFTKEKINIYAKLGCFISFFGVYVLIAYDANLPFRQHFLHGYLYAMLDAVIWAGYVVLCRKNKELHSEMIGAYCFIGMVLSMISHIKFETYIAPSFIQWISLISVGIFAQGLAYVLWEMGIKKGDLLLLSTSSYFTPIGSVTLLIFFSKAQYSHTLLVATLLVSLGALMTTKK